MEDLTNIYNELIKYRNQFLRENIADTRNKIKSGEYKLTNLN